ncbi:MAG TPA: cellulose biosynthesis cyclic di-GMP-binding regulatory protein BcsB [Gemmatimonadaceae bacterium]|nr:cellulose biosynthesis cyclic di-GMP-binding regulatory protein BcsB [Gemmatimonadaceae bacterium]
MNNHIKSLAAILFAVATGSSHVVLAQQPRPGTSPVTTTRPGTRSIVWQSTYAQQGFRDGVTLNGVSGLTDQYFRVPAGPVDRAVLHLRIDHDFSDYRYAALEVRVNDVTRRVVSLKGAGVSTTVDVPIAAREFSGRPLTRVTLRLSSALTDDRCFDQRVAVGFVHVAPESGMRVEFPGNSPISITNAWSILPETTTIILPATGTRMTPAEFRSAWQVYSALVTAGHQVRLARGWTDPVAMRGQPAVVIGDARAPDAVSPTAVHSQDNVSVEMVAGAPVLRVRGGDSASASALLALDWRDVATSPSLRVLAARASVPGARDGSRSFDELGIGSVVHDAVGHSEWFVPFSVRDFGSGAVPSVVTLDVIAGMTPGQRDDSLHVDQRDDALHVYLNDVLVHSAQLTSRGQPQRVRVVLPPYLLGARNNLRIVFQRPTEGGDCRFSQSASPVQILGTSLISTTASETRPADFWQLGPLFRAGFRAYLPAAYLDNAAVSLPFLGALSHSLPLWALKDVRFYTGGADIAGDLPFLVVSRAAPAGLTAPIRSEGRGAQLRSGNGELLLDVEGLSSTFLQIANRKSLFGLWIVPPANDPLSAPRALRLDRGNVAFVGNDGVEFAFQSDRDRTVRVAYATDISWNTLYERYRYWFIAVLWVLATAGLIYLVRQRNERRRRTS